MCRSSYQYKHKDTTDTLWLPRPSHSLPSPHYNGGGLRERKKVLHASKAKGLKMRLLFQYIESGIVMVSLS